jgi:hypothetical protein
MLDESTVEVPLTQGKVAIIDARGAERILQHKWYYHKDGYAARDRKLSDGPGRNIIFMHQTICEPAPGQDVDHVDRDGLNNRGDNLRPASRTQNNAHQQKRCDNSSGYRGVSWYAPTGKWMAKITAHGHQMYLGYFQDIKDAARAYDVAAIKHFGEFAYENIPDEH